MRPVSSSESELSGDRLRWKGIGGLSAFLGLPLIATGLSEPAFGFMGAGLSEPVCFFAGLRDVLPFTGVGVRGLRENSDGTPIADFGLRASKLPDNFGVGFGDGV